MTRDPKVFLPSMASLISQKKGRRHSTLGIFDCRCVKKNPKKVIPAVEYHHAYMLNQYTRIKYLSWERKLPPPGRAETGNCACQSPEFAVTES